MTSLIGDTDAVTSGTQWGVVERDAYDAYLDPTFMDASFATLSGNLSNYAFEPNGQGQLYDANVDNYHDLERVLMGGRWIQQGEKRKFRQLNMKMKSESRKA